MKTLSIAAICLIACIAVVFAADTSPTPPTESPSSISTAQQADLEVQFPIKPGFEGVQYSAAVPGFKLAGAKLRPKANKTTREMFVNRSPVTPGMKM